jgi:8-oxo-dGTP diphosphatase
MPIKILYFFANIYWFIFRPLTLGVVLLNIRSNKVLLVRHSYGNHKWYTPGGHLKRNEDFKDALIREMKEELSIDLEKDKLKLFGVYQNNQQYKRDTTVVFLSDQELKINDKNKLDKEILAVDFFDINKLPEDINQAVKRRIEELKNNTWPHTKRW